MRNKIFEAVKRSPHYLVSSVKLLWRRLPYIALYTVAFAGLIGAGQYLYHKVDYQNIAKQPGSDFINYTSFTVNNAREGEDITFTLCRDHAENYEVQGTRTVYVVPEGKSEAQKVFIYNKQVKGVVDTGNCQPYFIKETEYHFTPGKYLVTLNLGFKVKYGIEKSVFAKSSIFTIYPQPDGSTDVQSQLNNLQQQLKDQQDIINRLLLQNGGSIIEFQDTGATTNNRPAQTQPTTPAPVPQASAPSPPTPTSESCIIDVLGIRLLC